MGVLFLLVSTVPVFFALQLLEESPGLALLPLSLGGLLAILGVGLVRLKTWAYVATMALLALDLVATVAQGFTEGPAVYVRFGVEALILLYFISLSPTALRVDFETP